MIVEMIPIVEGHGEVRSVPIILRRLAAEVELYQVKIASPIRIPATDLFGKGKRNGRLNSRPAISAGRAVS